MKGINKVYINYRLEAAKRATELCQDNKEPYSNLTMIAALKQAAREFSKENRKDED